MAKKTATETKVITRKTDKTDKTETPVDETPVDKNEVLKSLVSEGLEFQAEWLDMEASDLVKILNSTQEMKAAFEEIKDKVKEKTLQVQQLMGVALHDNPTIWGNKSQTWAVSLSKVCCSKEFKVFLNSNKTISDIDVFLATCKDK